jgi:hypothetical protein
MQPRTLSRTFRASSRVSCRPGRACRPGAPRCVAPSQEPGLERQTPSLQSIQDGGSLDDGYQSPVLSLDWSDPRSASGGAAAVADPLDLGEPTTTLEATTPPSPMLRSHAICNFCFSKTQIVMRVAVPYAPVSHCGAR